MRQGNRPFDVALRESRTTCHVASAADRASSWSRTARSSMGPCTDSVRTPTSMARVVNSAFATPQNKPDITMRNGSILGGENPAPIMTRTRRIKSARSTVTTLRLRVSRLTARTTAPKWPDSLRPVCVCGCHGCRARGRKLRRWEWPASCVEWVGQRATGRSPRFRNARTSSAWSRPDSAA